MSIAFKEFLRQQAEKHEAQVKAGKATVEEWRTAVGKLFDQLRNWLAESDPDGLIQVTQTKHEAIEAGLGRYFIARLDLRAFGKWVAIIPKARSIVAAAKPPRKDAPEQATGRVDITDELRRYVLYRFSEEGGPDQWWIDELRSEGLKPLDQESFEKALMSYFR